MGTPVDTPVIGPNCGHWNPVDETPHSIFAMFWDVKPGDRGGAKEPPNGHIFKLTQKDGFTCDWIYASLTHGWEVNLQLQANNVWVDLRDSVNRNNVYFIDNPGYPPMPEYTAFTNDKLDPAGEWGWSGHCVVFWLNDIVSHADGLGLFEAPDLMMEFFAISTTEFVIKFCSLTLRTNVKLKISV